MINEIVQNIIDIEIIGVVFAKHRQCKTNPILQNRESSIALFFLKKKSAFSKNVFFSLFFHISVSPADEIGCSTPLRLSPNILATSSIVSATTGATSVNHHANTNYNSSSSTAVTSISTSEITETPGFDVFGNVTHGKGVPRVTYECKCPQCNRSIAATRFAPHLEKCMGMGRAASRAREVSYCEN